MQNLIYRFPGLGKKLDTFTGCVDPPACGLVGYRPGVKPDIRGGRHCSVKVEQDTVPADSFQVAARADSGFLCDWVDGVAVAVHGEDRVVNDFVRWGVEVVRVQDGGGLDYRFRCV